MSGIFDNTDWGGVVASTIGSSIIAIVIALYIRYKTKPKHEIIYDANRQANLDLIFGGLNRLGSEFGTIYDSIENRFGFLTENRDEIIPAFGDIVEIAEMNRTFDDIRPMLEGCLERMREQHRRFLGDYHIYLNFLNDSFLRDVNKYYLTTTFYSELLLQNENHYSIGVRRKPEAERIIKYVVKDRSVNKNKEEIKLFISDWEEVETRQTG